MGNNIRPPRKLLIIAGVLLVLAVIATPILQAQPREVMAKMVLVQGIPFLAVFVALLLSYIYLIFVAAARFTGNISERLYRPIEAIIIAGIVLGVVGVLQPVDIFGYQYGFLLLLISTLAFIAWSHVTPRHKHYTEEAGAAPASDQKVPQ